MERGRKAKTDSIADGGAIVVLDASGEDGAFVRWRIDNPNTRVRLLIFTPSDVQVTDSSTAGKKA